MLQCTAVARLPVADAPVALLDISGGPNDVEAHLADKSFVLCELGVHDETTDHTARLWTAEKQPPTGLWFTWTEISHLLITHRFATLTL